MVLLLQQVLKGHTPSKQQSAALVVGITGGKKKSDLEDDIPSSMLLLAPSIELFW